MRPKLLTAFSIFFLLLFISNFTNAQTGCCPSPDSLTVTSVTDSSFCVRWRITDSAHCDTPRAGQLQYRPVGTTNWTTVTFLYSYPFIYAIKCDTASPCTKYQWRVRNICVSGDTTFTGYVSGPRFTTTCDSAGFSKTNNNSLLHIYPNPAYSQVTIEGKIPNSPKVKITISDMTGNVKLTKEVTVINGALKLPVEISQWNKGIYFVTVFNKSINARYSFIKQ